MPTEVSFKVNCWGRGDAESAANALRFATKAEATAYAQDLYSRWMGLDRWEVGPSPDPVNYRWDREAYRAVRLKVT